MNIFLSYFEKKNFVLSGHDKAKFLTLKKKIKHEKK